MSLLKRESLPYTDREARQAIKKAMEALPIAKSHAEFLANLTGGELIATLFVAQFPLIYGGEGEGLFSGMERYQFLTTRLVDGATCCSTLPTVWGYVARKLALPMYGEARYRSLLALYSLPKPIQACALTAILKAPEYIVMSARLIAEGVKATDEKYAEKAKTSQEEAVVYDPTPTQIAELSGSEGSVLAARIPAISGNSLRHNLVRAPGTTRLLCELDLSPDREIVPVGVERFLYSGGNTVKGAKAPAAVDVYEARARELYPLIDALGGSFDQFVMTRSQLSIASWIVCKENNWITERKTDGEAKSQTSVFDLVSEITRTRSGIGGKDAESGQMIYSYETLAAQTQVLIEVGWQPYTRPLTVGATLQALIDWQAEGGYIGARSAQGHSQLSADFPADDRFELAENYLHYIRANIEEMRAGLRSATFGNKGVRLCAA